MKVSPMPARCVIHSVNCADMKQHPLVPEKPECRAALAVLSSEMLAGDRKALFPRSWFGPKIPLLYAATAQERDGIQISITIQGSVTIILYAWRPADAEHTVQYCARVSRIFANTSLWRASSLKRADYQYPTNPSQISDFAHDIRLFRKAQHEMVEARAERKRSVSVSVTEAQGSRQGRT